MRASQGLKISAYVATFVLGMWGGKLLIEQLSNNSEGNRVAQAMVGQPAPAFSLPDLNHTTHQSHEWRDKVVVLNFWATWCPPCRKETPMFIDLQEEYAARGLQFVGLAIDEEAKVREFMESYGVNYPMLIGEDDAIQVAKAYGNQFGALPYSVIIDRAGTIRFIQRGELTRDTALEQIRPLL